VVDSDDEYQEFLKLAWRAFKEGRITSAKTQRPDRTIAELHQSWLPTVPRASRDLRRTQGQRYLNLPFQYAGRPITLGSLKASECTVDILTHWVAFLGDTIARGTDRVLSPCSVDGIRMGLQAMFTYCVRTGEISENPLRKIPRDKRRKREREGYLTLQETDAHAAKMPLIGGYILRHCFATGCRQSNIRELRKSQIDWSLSHLKLTVKGGDQQRVIVPRSTLEEMRQLCAVSPSDLVYPNPRNPHKPVTRGTLCDWIDKACRDLKCSPKHVVHETRHGQALAFLSTPGATLTMLQRRLGHRTIEQTARYARVRDRMMDDMARIAEQTVQPTNKTDK
jgi:integrase